MKNWRILILGLVVYTNSAFAILQEIDRIVAIVNNDAILQSDITNMKKMIKLNALQTDQQLPDNIELNHQILEQLIMDNIQLQIAKKIGINISDDDLNKVITNIATKNRMTINQMRNQLIKEGIDYKNYRMQILKEILISEVRNNEVLRHIIILPQEIESLTQQISNQINEDTELNISYILISIPENSSQQQKNQSEKQANKIIAKIKAGANFTKLAKANWPNLQSLKSGEIGWSRRKELPSLFATKLYSVNKGDIVGPIRSEVGFYILKINNIRRTDKAMLITEVHARHILLKPSNTMTDNQAQAKLQTILQEIKSGKTNFTTVAKEISEDPNSAKQGGDLGWATYDTYDPAFCKALLKLKKGAISIPVRSLFGWHLIELLNIRKIDYSNIIQKNRAYEMLITRKFVEKVESWMQQQRAASYVKILDNNYLQK
ncbi:peptidylprolyl isomerase SurA [Candidatus Fukatsuia anoeciicola]|uniref:peptidylprolyl isomerase SurA n=1 Tax=Candidatus Fukatsuia anoeciicola TaxID=2994492 RepID=UPI003463D8EE